MHDDDGQDGPDDGHDGGRDGGAERPFSGETHSAAASELTGETAAPVAAQLLPGDVVGRYQVRRLIGEGGMGRVYLGRDTTLGRSVALKVVRSESVGPAQAARILREARVIATLNHPHIVQLYDVVEHAGILYLALEYVDGDSLRTRAAQAPFSVDESLRHVRAIAEALAHAHSHGVYHCDLKPGNVMVGRDGRLRVVDFGIAQTADVDSGQIAGTEEWMAPEQHTHAPLTDRVDTWALGLLAAVLLTGRHPLGSQRELGLGSTQSGASEPGDAPRRLRRLALHRRGAGIPMVIEELIERSLQHEPAARPTAEDWLRALDELVTGRGEQLGEEGPYRGLSSFDEPCARFFFGREADVDAFLERLRDAPCLPIVGPSGVGKSSFLHAGVIPRLRARERWTVLTLRPGAEPIAALARQVVQATDAAAAASEPVLREQALELAQKLHDTPTHLAARLAAIAAASGSRVLLAIDQLEEVFTQGASDGARQRFLAMVLAAADDAQDPVRVVFTVRDDFLGQIPELRSLFVMRRMSPDELRRTIVGPLPRIGYRFDDPSVVEEMLGEVAKSDVADLPLVQFVCRALWDGRDAERRVLRRSTYLELGGISGALGRHAEAALKELSQAEHRAARQLLLPLVKGTTRRSIPRPQLLAQAPGAAAAIEAVLDRLLAARLLVQRTPEEEEGAPLVEIAHESLVSSWPQLVRWLEESRDERRLLAELEDAAGLWERRGRRDEDALKSGELEALRERASQLDLTLPPSVQALLAASEQRNQRQRRRKLRRAVGVTAVISAVIAVVVVWVGQSQLRDRKARGNFGRVELRLHPFEYTRDGKISAIAIDQLPQLRWTLYTARSDDENEPGAQLPDEVVSVRRLADEPTARIDRVEAPGGMAFLKIENRGRAGERCAPSWLRLRSLPGYSTAAQGSLPRLDIYVPTCGASQRDMVRIEGGPFIFGGTRIPLDEDVTHTDYHAALELVDLPTFSIDKTEVSNAALAPFAGMQDLTGYWAPLYSAHPDEKHRHDGDLERPVTSINAYMAEAFCRFHGKTLPTDHQWVKALRGGVMLAGKPNPAPARLFPWGDEDKADCANLAGGSDGHPWLAPVDAMPCDTSPYGVKQMAGNVEEWMALSPVLDAGNPLRAMRGGAPDSPPRLLHHTSVFRNHRGPRALDYAIGLRCAESGDIYR